MVEDVAAVIVGLIEDSEGTSVLVPGLKTIEVVGVAMGVVRRVASVLVGEMRVFEGVGVTTGVDVRLMDSEVVTGKKISVDVGGITRVVREGTRVEETKVVSKGVATVGVMKEVTSILERGVEGVMNVKSAVVVGSGTKVVRGMTDVS